MKQNKTIMLISGLTDKEAKLLEISLNKMGKQRLSTILSVIRRAIGNKKTLNDDLLFKAVFNEEHSKENNFKLRNELRLLNIEISDFLVAERLKKTIKNKTERYTHEYLQELLERGLNALFEKESNKAIQYFTQIGDVASLEEACWQRLQYNLANSEVADELYGNHMLQIANLKQIQEEHQLIKHHKLLYKEFFCRRVLYGLGQKHTPLPDLIPLNKQMHPLAEFYAVRANTYISAGDEKISLLQHLLKLSDSISYPGFDAELERFTILAVIALEYYLVRKFDKSLVFSQKAYERMNAVAPLQAAKFLHNHCSLLMRLERFNDSLELIQLHWHIVTGNVVEPRMRILMAVCSVFTGQPEKAIEVLPERIHSYSQFDRNYIRILEAIALHDMGNMDTALYRLNAAIKNLGTNKHFDGAPKAFALLFKRYITLEQGLKDETYPAKIDTLYKNLQQFSQQDNILFGSDNFLVMWLLRKTSS